jgi:putative drug exporter of the RND superfamily
MSTGGAGGSPDGPLARWGHFVARRPRAVLRTALVLVVIGLALAPVFRSNLLGLGYGTQGTESARATATIAERTGVEERSTLVVSSRAGGPTGPALRAATDRAIGVVRERDDVVRGVVPQGLPGGGRTSADGHVVTATVLMHGTVGDRQGAAEDLQAALAKAMPDGVTAALTGPSPLLSDLVRVESADMATAELVGLPIAFVVLLLTLRSAVAAAVPLLLGLAGLGLCFGVLAATLLVADWNLFVETLFVMIGLGVGIDYALLVVRRFREELARGSDPPEAIARTLDTAGRTVVFSGAIVAISMVALATTGLPFFGEAAVAVMLVVLLTVAATLTLLPALLLRLGPRLERWRLPGGTSREEASVRRWERWGRAVVRRPWTVTLVAVFVLLAAAAPAVGIRSGTDLNARAMAGEPAADALQVLERAFPDASLAPVEVLVRSTDAGLGSAVPPVRAAVERERLLGPVTRLGLGGGDAVLVADPSVPADSSEAASLVERLRPAVRAAAPPGTTVQVAGPTAELLDFGDATDDATPYVLVVTLALAFLLLTAVFRSPVLALKAIVMNLFSVAAAIGLTVLVFQEGLGESVLGFTSPGYLQSWMPLTLFMIVFGLSMDYEVFMVTRIREEYDRTGDTVEAIVSGLARTGTVVTSAAAIMVAIFGAAVLTRIPEIKQMGFGLAVAVLLDATIVRGALVPAVMRLAGPWNWWMPRWLDRVLPTIRHGAPGD